MVFAIVFGVAFTLNAQTGNLTGKVTDSGSKPIPGAIISIGTSQFKTDALGVFNAVNVAYGKGEISITAEGFDPQIVEFDITKTSQDLGEIKLANTANNSTINEGSIATLDMEEDSKQQSISGILHSSSDVFVNTASYIFSAAYFRMRGYDGEFSEVMLNGLSMSNSENGRSMYSNWGGLNDVTHVKESVTGLTPAHFSFGGMVGTTNIDFRAANQRKQTKISYAFSNKTYTNRVMITHSTGLMENGWAFTVSASRRWGDEGYVKGTFYDASSYFLSAEKKINNKHSIALTAFGAPVKKGMQSASVQECYDLLDNNYYNSAWGYQDGKVRNSKVKTSHEPTALLTHTFDITPKTKLISTLGYTFGRTGTTALNWYNSADPRPDYYHYLPSYQTDPALATAYTNLWQNDENISQINWNKLYQINYLSNNMGEQAKYIIEERRVDMKQYGFASYFNHELNKSTFLSGGIDVRSYTGRNYKVISDMLGGNFWLDVDQFAERDFSGDTITSQNDLNNPNRVVKEGDTYGYDYESHVNTQNIWALGEFSLSKIDFYAALNATTTQYWRVGNMKNGRYPENSYGTSEKQTFFNYAAKIGATYKITGRHFITGNAMYMTSAPTFKNAYISPRISDKLISNLGDRKIMSGDISYVIRHPKIKGRATLYYTTITDDVEMNSYYHDVLRTYVNTTMTGVNKLHQGLELGIEAKATSSISIIGVISKGDFRYTSRPVATTSVENGSIADTSQTIYCKNFYVNGTPQTAASLGLKWQGPKFWYLNINANYFDDIWVDFSPERRTIGAIDGLYNNPELVTLITKQEKVPGQFTLDASISKSWKIKQYTILFNASVSNILDNQKLVTSAYEQLRFDFEGKNIDKFPSKYYYGFGRTYFISLGIRF
jgi:hypothetical protein